MSEDLLPAGRGRSHQTAHEFARATLRRAILGGEMHAGTRLVQSDLAAQLGVSTTPVREALRDLAAEGLIDLDAHRGGVVHELEIDELREIHAIRERLEPLAIELAIERITDDELARAERMMKQLDEIEDDLGTWLDLNRQFHFIFYRAAHSPRLLTFLEQLQNGTAMYVGQAARNQRGVIENASEEHRRFFEAFQRHDAEEAIRIALNHIQNPVRLLT